MLCVAVVATVVATAGEHLKRLGIDVNCLVKTEKSTAELQIELNLNYNFSAVTEEGASLVGVHCLGVGVERLCASFSWHVLDGSTFETEHQQSEAWGRSLWAPY